MRVFDTFLFRDEVDMLQCRLEQLDGVVDVFVIVEAGVTHGERLPKPWNYLKHAERFAAWQDRIRYVKVPADAMPDGPDPWARERYQREQTAYGLDDIADDDLILHGDVDEIPAPRAVREAAAHRGMRAFGMRMTHFAVDWLDPEPWAGTVACPARYVQGFTLLWQLRTRLGRISDGGWHFSALGTIDQQADHVRFGCHMPDAIREGAWDDIRTGRAYRDGWHQGQHKLIPVDVDDTWPRYIYERRCPVSWFRPRGQLPGSAPLI